MDSLRRHTPRLDLVPLSIQQLKWTLDSPPTLEQNLGIQFDAAIIDENVIRAIGMKLTKMAKLPVEKHLWQTYWLIILRAEGIGIGLAGFKSPPDDEGLSEIGYGIAPAWQNRGYMSEALQGLLDWAFAQFDCLGVTATAVQNSASRRLLEKLGAALLEKSEHESSWVFRKRKQRQPLCASDISPRRASFRANSNPANILRGRTRNLGENTRFSLKKPSVVPVPPNAKRLGGCPSEARGRGAERLN